MCESRALQVLFDTRNISLEIHDELTKSYEDFLFFLLNPKSYKITFPLQKSSLLKQNALRDLYNEMRAESNILNSLYVYDNAAKLNHKSFLKEFFEKYLLYEEAIGRVLCLFYRAMEEEKKEFHKDFQLKLKMVLDVDSGLLSKIKEATNLINDICERLFSDSAEEIKELGLFRAFQNLGPLDPIEILEMAVGPETHHQRIWENNMVFVSRYPWEPLGAMCRFWNPRLPVVVFSPFYGNYISSLTFVHELGHLVHYKHHLSMDQTSFEGIYEEFFAFVFELSWLLKNPWNIQRELLQKIFWQRIWFITARQFQLFSFELLNLKSSSEGIMSLDILKQNWKQTSIETLGVLAPQGRWYENSWIQIAQIINLPFRSLDYTISALLALFYIHKKGYLEEAILQTKNIEELVKEIGLSSLEDGIERLISILSPSIPTL